MIGKHIGPFLLQGEDPLMIDAEHCATVRTENTLMHAMLLLSSVGFTSVPVLDESSHLAGVIGMPAIFKGILGDDDYHWDQLDHRKVKDVMERNVFVVYDDSPLEDILHLLVNANYLCVTDRDGLFLGIIARKQLLKRFNRFAHEFENHFKVTPRESKPVSAPQDLQATKNNH
ncbi:MAG: CBS domain-containing protein [Clostridiaceae bacterium]|jgi:predicted transcriptional regulator|nr:CBS domain-containing protein [Clostridiaceae bacterium]